MCRRFLSLFISSLVISLVGVTAAQACLGVSRTIYVNSFAAHLGTGGSGGIGLRHKEVVLTFDDGPKASTTPRVLNALSAECTKATFFVVGRMARANPKLLQRIARTGHTIAQHTHNHANLAHGSIASAQRNIERGMIDVNKALGPYKSSSTRLFRYPYLSRSNALDSMIRRRGLLPLSAGVLSQDWKSGSGPAMVNRVMSRLNRTQRGIILLHDIQTKTASHLPALLDRLKAGGYKVVHIRSGRSPKASTAIAAFEPKNTRRKAKNRKKTVQIAALSTRKKRKTVSRIKITKKDVKKRKGVFSRWRSGTQEKKTAKRTAKKKAKRLVVKRTTGKKTKRSLRLFGRSADADNKKYRVRGKLPGNLKRRKGESLKSHFYRVRAARKR